MRLSFYVALTVAALSSTLSEAITIDADMQIEKSATVSASSGTVKVVKPKTSK